ncbi:MAG: DUF2442 domain-containing protein [Bacteroidota bacterium]|nr:DUF2442 domain-containing protein [Bacteroidota bacterium]
MNKIINIISVTPLENYQLHIEFEDGLNKKINVLPFIKNGISKYILDLNNFKKVKAENGYVIWDNGYDLCPVFLRELDQ